MARLPCGCNIEHDYDETMVEIRLRSESICILDGVMPAVECFRVCNLCYEDRYSKYPDLILTDEEETLWLNTKF